MLLCLSGAKIKRGISSSPRIIHMISGPGSHQAAFLLIPHNFSVFPLIQHPRCSSPSSSTQTVVQVYTCTLVVQLYHKLALVSLWFNIIYVLMLHSVTKCSQVVTSYAISSITLLQNAYILLSFTPFCCVYA